MLRRHEDRERAIRGIRAPAIKVGQKIVELNRWIRLSDEVQDTRREIDPAWRAQRLGVFFGDETVRRTLTAESSGDGALHAETGNRYR